MQCISAGMGAPQVTIETITVTRPLKVIAFTFCFITVILMVAATSTADWMLADGWREGLFMQCISEGAPTPLPFDMPLEAGCGAVRSASYLRGAAALVIIGLIFDFFGTFLTGLGLRSTDPNKKYKYYRVAIYALILALIALLLAAIIYPVQFSKDLANEPPKDGGKVQAVGSLDFDNDGIIDIADNDDDNDGIPDDEDNDDDNDGIKDNKDDDDDNGIPDALDNQNPEDFDGDGMLDDEDPDDDNDGIDDEDDTDDDNDGFPDDVDKDDGDGVNEDDDDFDNDGIADEEDPDDDNDGTLDAADPDDDNDGIDDEEDDDDDNDGITDDVDDDNEGVEDENDDDDEDDDDAGARTYTFGFGYGATWGSIILIFASVVLLICDRESEEIFYKERQVEEEEE